MGAAYRGRAIDIPSPQFGAETVLRVSNPPRHRRLFLRAPAWVLETAAENHADYALNCIPVKTTVVGDVAILVVTLLRLVIVIRYLGTS